MARFSERSIKALYGVHPFLVHLMCEAIANTPFDFTIVSGVRTLEEQQKLYAQGRTAPGPIVTNADGIRNKSNHQAHADGFGRAVDIYPYFDGAVQVNHPDTVRRLKHIASHIDLHAELNGYNVEWGGDWKMKDYPHFEIRI